MKKMLPLLLLILMLSSCRIMQRKYRDGYYLPELSKSAQNHSALSKKVSLVNGSINPICINHLTTHPIIEKTKPTKDIIYPEIIATKEVIYHNKLIVSKRKKELKTTTSNNNGCGGGAMALGIIFIVGGAIAWIAGLFITGPILIVLGVVIVILGAASSKSNKDSSENKPKQMQDVIYLKNGSIIRGIIIENIPNESIKIETKDGSTFVYKMDEIIKMTKEKEK